MQQGQTFVDLIGPIWRRLDAGGATLRLEIEQRHTNPGSSVHGGVLMTLMDLALGSSVEGALSTGSADGRGHPITVQLSCNMIAGAKPGEMLEARAQVDRVTRSMAFASGRILVGERVLMTGSAVFKTPTSNARSALA